MLHVKVEGLSKADTARYGSSRRSSPTCVAFWRELGEHAGRRSAAALAVTPTIPARLRTSLTWSSEHVSAGAASIEADTRPAAHSEPHVFLRRDFPNTAPSGSGLADR